MVIRLYGVSVLRYDLDYSQLSLQCSFHRLVGQPIPIDCFQPLLNRQLILRQHNERHRHRGVLLCIYEQAIEFGQVPNRPCSNMRPNCFPL